MKIDREKTLYIRYSKQHNGLIVDYPNRQGMWLGYEIKETIKKEIKEYATDFDITTVKCQIKLKPKEGNNDR